MMGRHDRSETLFYYFRLEDQVPENHLLRLIEKHVSFEFLRERCQARGSCNIRKSNSENRLLYSRESSAARWDRQTNLRHIGNNSTPC